MKSMVVTCFLLFFTAMFARADMSWSLGPLGYWDAFVVNLTPEGLYWELVDGGSGTLSDPLVHLDPAGQPVIDYHSVLGGVAWVFGGSDYAGSHTLETAKSTYSIQLIGQSDYYLSIVLDTATSPFNDDCFPSWGRVYDIEIRPGTPGDWGQPITPDWLISPYDKDNGTVVIGGSTSSVSLAVNYFDYGEYEKQELSIWGVAAHLPEAQGYLVTFSTDLYTWDAYAVERTPEPATVLLLGLGSVILASRRIK